MTAPLLTARVEQRWTSLPRVRIAAGVGLAALSAFMLYLAFPPFNLWPLIWVALVPALLAQYRVLPAGWSSLAMAVAIGLWLGFFFIDVFAGLLPLWVRLLFPLGIAGFNLMGTRVLRPFHEQTRYRWLVLEGSFAWVGFEMIRHFFIGSWAFIGHALWHQPWLIQPVSIFGTFGLNLLILLVNYALALGLIGLSEGRRRDAEFRDSGPEFGRYWLGGVALLVLAWIGLSLALYATRPATPEMLRVAAVQHGLNQFYVEIPEMASEVEFTRWLDQVKAEAWERIGQQTRAVAAQGARIVVWPEGSLWFDPLVERTADLQQLAAETGAILAIGYNLATEEGQRNEATVLTPAGEFLGVYGKDHPVWFVGEQSISGGSYPVYETAFGRLAAIVCYDLSFTDSIRSLAGQGAGLILAPSNEWPAIAERFYTHAVFRAVENRTAVVKGDSAYTSAVVDPFGRIVARTKTPQGELTTLVADVPLGATGTFYTRVGDWVGWLSLAGYTFFTMYFIPRTMRRKKALESRYAAD